MKNVLTILATGLGVYYLVDYFQKRKKNAAVAKVVVADAKAKVASETITEVKEGAALDAALMQETGGEYLPSDLKDLVEVAQNPAIKTTASKSSANGGWDSTPIA